MPNRIVTKDNFKVGDKVVRGRDWRWGDQDKGSVYGVIGNFSVIADNTTWHYVHWVDYKGKELGLYSYRIGHEKFDLYFYEQ